MSSIHYTILIDSKSETKALIDQLLKGTFSSGFSKLKGKKGELFSSSQVAYFLNKEEQHGIKIITKETQQLLLTMSSGERKKALLNYFLKKLPDYLILVNPYDNLDSNYQKELKEKLIALSNTILLIQIVSRKEDILPIHTKFIKLNESELIHYKSKEAFFNDSQIVETNFSNYKIPLALNPITSLKEVLIRFIEVSVSFNNNPVLLNITWTIKSGEFWHLKGPNGSGKSTLLSMITGDSQKGYGQHLYLFGTKKGSGESVWDIKKHIGYFTPAMTDKFRGYHTLENMLISGLHDSIGLYVKPTENEKRLAIEWLKLLNLNNKKEAHFHQLTTTEKRLLMTARAMIKHPPLLILDEPTAGLDDYNAALFVSLINKVAKESKTAIIFVSHRKEHGLNPTSIFELIPTKNGSMGKIHYF
ncbi:ATP-binding cassette domain-containing protein [uncultured Croceitalea sp.]|uniref:ABC transporter ATP-binding protein n=1 Tax=uncultured Croceitalea sp. TaxID=1798908 RepID=UPI00330567B6